MFFVQMHNIRAGGGRLFFPVVSAKAQKLLPSNWTCSNKRQGRGLFDFQSIKTRSPVLRACSSSLPHNTTSCKSKLSHQQKEPKIVQLCMLLLVQLKNRLTSHHLRNYNQISLSKRGCLCTPSLNQNAGLFHFLSIQGYEWPIFYKPSHPGKNDCLTHKCHGTEMMENSLISLSKKKEKRKKWYLSPKNFSLPPPKKVTANLPPRKNIPWDR